MIYKLTTLNVKENMFSFLLVDIMFNMKIHRWKKSHEYSMTFLTFLADLVVIRKF